MNRLHFGTVRWLVSIALAGLLAAGSAGCGSQKAAKPKPLDGPKEAVELYRQNCLSCHGAELEGQMGPRTNLQKVGASLTQEQIRNQIANGGGGMPAQSKRLTPQQIETLAAWLATRK